MAITVDPKGLHITVDKAEDAVQIGKAIDEMSKKGVPDSTDELLKKYPALGAIMNDPNLTPFKKKLAAMPILKKVQQEIGHLEKEGQDYKDRAEFAKRLIAIREEYDAWRVLPPRLEKNDRSRLHQLIASLKEQFVNLREIAKGQSPFEYHWQDVTPFVVEHDWAGAFKNATDYNDGQFNLPLSRCAFEFRITGRSVTILAGQEDDQHEPTYRMYVNFHDHWVSEEENREFGKAYEFALSQIKAICVALDAEVATRNVVRVKDTVNRKRIAEGREPFYSYHVVSLSRRYRVANPAGGGGVSKGKKRLHFRRGHWRHYAEFKTWVRWTLVGNPELGFIDKEYRL